MNDKPFHSSLSFHIDDSRPGELIVTDNIIGSITRTFYDVRSAAVEKAIVAKLIELGWTPPPGTTA